MTVEHDTSDSGNRRNTLMRRMIINAIVSGLVFGYLVSLMFFFLISVTDSLMAALKAWLLLGLAGALVWVACVVPLLLFQNAKAKKMCRIIESQGRVLFNGPAGHFRGMISDGGWLYLTDEGLLFKPHKMNLSWQDVWIPNAMIVGVERYKNMGIVSNGLLLTLKDETQEKFTANWSREWVRIINSELGLS